MTDKKDDETIEEKHSFVKGPGGSALGDTLRAVDALEVEDPETVAMIYRMLNGGE